MSSETAANQLYCCLRAVFFSSRRLGGFLPVKSHEELYGEFIDALTVSQNTKVVMLVGNMPSYNKESVKQLQEVTDREVYYFNMNPQESQQYAFKYNNLGYVLLHAMGIKPEELE